MSTLTISKSTQRRFVLGKQGLYPGRRWHGRMGVVEALRAGAVVQVDPFNVVARSHDIVLYERVLDYRPAMLHALLYEDLPLLETLHAGQIPAEWQPLATSTEDEMTFLAPLEIVSARGRASSLFDFEYLWEVYKPQEKRRWGYYTLPILYRDRLVARTDLKLERATNTLVIKGFWLEDYAVIDDQFITALTNAFTRFMSFTDAQELDSTSINSTKIGAGLRKRFIML